MLLCAGMGLTALLHPFCAVTGCVRLTTIYSVKLLLILRYNGWYNEHMAAITGAGYKQQNPAVLSH